MKEVFMSDRVFQLIDKIKEKSIRFHSQYQAERKSNALLEEKVNALNETIDKKEKEIELALNRINDLQEEIKTVKEQKVDVPVANEVNDEQIDELVKEIEFCIAQLKQ